MILLLIFIVIISAVVVILINALFLALFFGAIYFAGKGVACLAKYLIKWYNNLSYNL